MSNFKRHFILAKIFQKIHFYQKHLKEIILNQHFLLITYCQLDESYIKTKVANPKLQNKCKKCVRKICKEKNCFGDSNPEWCLALALSNLDCCERYINIKNQKFIKNIEKLTQNIYCISSIQTVIGRLCEIEANYNVCLENIKNLRTSLNQSIIKSFLKDHYQKVLIALEKQFDITPADMESYDETQSETDDFSIEETLSSEADSASKEDLSKDNIKNKEAELYDRMRSITEVETKIANLDDELQRIRKEKEVAQKKLIEMQKDLKLAIEKLGRLNALIDNVSKDISTKINVFQDQLEVFEKDRVEILRNDQLTPSEKRRLLEDINKKISELRKCHKQALSILEQQKEELADKSREHAKEISPLWERVKKDHEAQIAALEEQKQKATRAEVKRISAEIRKIKKDFEDEYGALTLMDAEPEFFRDDLGRYFVRPDGIKVYKAHSVASEYIIDRFGDFIKIKDGVELLMDKVGDYYLDECGDRIYVREYFTDSIGRYYLDKQGREIYKADPYAPEYILENGKLIKLSSVHAGTDMESVDEDEAKTVEEDDMSDEQKNLKYVQNQLGKPLRKALAAAVVYQPTDPICFIANYLLQYRHNEILANIKQNKVTQLLLAQEEAQRKAIEEKEHEANLDYAYDPCQEYLNF